MLGDMAPNRDPSPRSFPKKYAGSFDRSPPAGVDQGLRCGNRAASAGALPQDATSRDVCQGK